MAAPKGNKFAEGHGWGRPPLYETPEDLLKMCDDYFESVTTRTGICKATITGLTFHVGFASRASWDDYARRSEDFSYVVKRVKLFVESCYESNMHTFNWPGSAFVLKNMNSAEWKDKTEQTQRVEHVTVNFDENADNDKAAEAN